MGSEVYLSRSWMYSLSLVKFRFLSLLFFLIFIVSPSISQQLSPSDSFLKSCFTDAKSMVVQPYHWDKNDLANVTLITGATAFVMLYDSDIDQWIRTNHNKGLNSFSRNVIGPFGSGLYSLPIAGGLYVSGVVMKEPYDKEMAGLMVKAFVSGAGLATATKIISGRQRPGDFSGTNSPVFEGPELNDKSSFVSRHTCIAFSMATVLSMGYADEKPWVPAVAYTVATLVAASRTYENKHWASDAIAGACLGYVSGRFLFDLNYKRLKKYKK